MNYNNTPKHQRGFTIVEILVVIVVIAILAAITIVSYNAVTNNAKQKTAETDAQGVAAHINKYKAENGAYPADLSVIDKGTSVQSTFQYTYNATAGTFCVTASVNGASAYVRSNNSTPVKGGCPGHGVNGQDPIVNLASNPSAEANQSWPGGVSGYNSAVPGTTAGGAVSGAYVFSTTTNSASSVQGLIHTVTTSAKPNQAYTCSMSFKGTAGAALAFGGRPATATDAYLTESIGGKNFTLSSSWQRVDVTFTTPANTGILRVQYRLLTAATGVNIQSDALICTEGSTVRAFGDGSKANWAWDGAANLSSSRGPAL